MVYQYTKGELIQRYALVAVFAVVFGFILGLCAPRQPEPDWQVGELPTGQAVVGLYVFSGEVVPLLIQKTGYAGIYTYGYAGQPSQEIVKPSVWAHIPVSMYLGGYNDGY